MMIILAPEIPEEELDPTIDTIETYITRGDGSVVVINRESPWGRRRLAYPIRYQGRDVRDGFYTLWYFDAEPGAIVDIEREIRLNDRIIRHIIIALDEQVTLLPPEPQAAEGGAAEGGEAETAAATEGGEAETAAATEGGEAETVAAAATAPEAPAADAEPETAAPAEAAPADEEAAEADTSVASAAAPEATEEVAAVEEAAPAENGDETTKE
jgi:small subunit ribosomal protein S6